MDVAETPQAAETASLGTEPVPAGAEALVSTPAAVDDSLAAHEAAHSPNRDRERDPESGQFQPKERRRAKSQQADADDVPAINEQTKRLKALEETHGKDIVRKDGESERVFNLRRRADLLERLNAPTQHATTPAPRQAEPVAQPSYQPPPQQPQMQAFPEYEDVLQMPGYEGLTFNQYLAAQAQWVYKQQRDAERAQEAQEKANRSANERLNAHYSRLPEARQKYADWDTVVPRELDGTQVIVEAVLSSAHSTDALYYLGKNRDILAALNAESQDYSPSAVSAMRRYLDSLVAAPQRTSPSPRAVAGSTGSALALAPPPAPRPPNPVRTSAVTPADEPPDDNDMSISAHEKHFGRRRG